MAKPKLTKTETAAWAGLVRAQQMLLRKVEADLKAAGLPPLSWYDVLLELGRRADGRLRLSEIADQVLLSRYNVTRLVDRLEKQGLVERKPCEDDARGAFAVITPEGRRLCDRMWPVYRKAVRTHLLDHFANDELDQMARWMRRIVDAGA